jgi:hypothetical protein
MSMGTSDEMWRAKTDHWNYQGTQNCYGRACQSDALRRVGCGREWVRIRESSEEEAMGFLVVFIVMTVSGERHPETRTLPTVGTPEQDMIVGELDELEHR